MKKQTLGDYCKWLEKNFSPEIMIPTLPVIIRLDGNNFSSYTKGLEKPFDKRLVKLMQDTTEFLVKETNAVLGYTQSDEITLVLYSSDRTKEIYNSGKKQKILSKLAAKASVFFNKRRLELLPDHNKEAIFDCRVYQTPSLEDASLQILWRERDAIRNSVSVLAQCFYSQQQLHGLNSDQKRQKLREEKGVEWEDLATELKKGSYIMRYEVTKKLDESELSSLPEKHQARLNPDLEITRSVVELFDLPPLDLVQNKVEVLFFNKKPNGKD